MQCRRSQYGARPSPSELVALLKGVAHDLNATGYPGGPYGVLQKTSGANCNGYSCDIICVANGPLFDVFIDGPDATQNYAGTAVPSWDQKPPNGVCQVVP